MAITGTDRANAQLFAVENGAQHPFMVSAENGALGLGRGVSLATVGGLALHQTVVPDAQFFGLDRGVQPFDLIKGDDGQNVLGGTSSDDTIKGFGGDDFIQAYAGNDTVYGGDGNDNIGGGNGFDTLYGGDGDDTIQGGGNEVILTMTGPSDVIEGGQGFDKLLVNYQAFVNAGDHQPAQLTIDFSTGTGQVLVSGFQGENFSHMESLNVVCPDGDDVITGGKNNDRIDAYLGNDIVKCMGGDDIVSDTGGFLNVDGGKGFDNMELFRDSDTADDIIDCEMGTLSVGGVDMGTFKNFEWGYMYGGSANDTITGFSTQFNSLNGNGGNDTLRAGSFNDWLNGGDGDDKLFGGAGNDLINGGIGTNVMDAGDGNDAISSFGTDKVDGGSGDDVLRVNPINMVAGTQYSGGIGSDTMHIAWDSGPGTYDITHASLDGWESMIGLGYNTAGLFTLEMSVGQLMSFGVIQLNQPVGTSVIELHNRLDVTLAPDSEFSVLQLADGGQHADLSAVTSAGLPSVTGGTGADTVIGPTSAAVSFVANLGDGDDHFTSGGANATVSGGNDNDTLTGGSGVNTLSGNAGNDTLTGGVNNDVLTGGTGADHLDGAAGLDTFVYLAVSDSTGVDFDTVSHFDANAQDKFNLASSVGGIDATVASGLLTTANFDTDLQNAVGMAQLKVGHAVLFTPTTGDYIGDTFLIVDADGHKGYQAGGDLVIMLDGATHLGNLDITDFI